MRSIEKLASKEKNIENFSKRYVERLNLIFKKINLKELSKLEKEFLDLRKKKIHIICFW